ncbi:Rho GTPase activation protein [Pilobolus umbonatus]|nr:Rho GTPase activation protein [Pilobolus umbonatus]
MGSRYRHAFFILERNNSSEDSIKHILYAESEIEREAWLAALRNYIHIHITDNILNSTFMFEKDNTQNTPNTTGDICIESPSIDKETVPKKKACTNGFKCQGNTPISTESNQSKAVVSEVIPVSNELEDSKKMFKNRSNRRTFWAKVKFSSSNGSPPKMASLGSRYPQHNSTLGSRQVFGIPLEYAVSISRSSANDELPAIVHRCIEYIEAKGGLNEEGIYRLSGSAANIKTLKKRFNEEGDLNLLEDNCCHDVHEVAGLLKMWLRELPENIMTNALLSKFFGSLGLESQQQKVHEMGRLVSLLPVANYNLIQSLCAHLIRIVDNSDMNKMTMRNMSIVFSATLEIPSGVFTLLLTHFDYIFWSTRCSGDPLATIEQYMEDVSSDDSTVFDSSIDNSSSFSSNTSSIQTSVRIKTCSLGQYQDTAPNDLIRNERQLNGMFRIPL